MTSSKVKIRLTSSKTKNLQTQQTPNPLAHDPDEVPPLVEHSDLEMIIDCNIILIEKQVDPYTVYKKRNF